MRKMKNGKCARCAFGALCARCACCARNAHCVRNKRCACCALRDPACACLPAASFCHLGIHSGLLASILCPWLTFCRSGVQFCFLPSILSCWLPFLLLSIIYSILLTCISAVCFCVLPSWQPSLLIHFGFLASMLASEFPLQPQRLLRPPRPCLRLLACRLILSSWRHVSLLASFATKRLAAPADVSCARI